MHKAMLGRIFNSTFNVAVSKTLKAGELVELSVEDEIRTLAPVNDSLSQVSTVSEVPSISG